MTSELKEHQEFNFVVNHTMNSQKAIRNQYAAQGVARYYQQHGATYRNPHEAVVQSLLQTHIPHWQLDLSHVLDLACGSGEVTLTLQVMGAKQVDGIDPYTYKAFEQRTGQPCERLTFEAIAQGEISTRQYSLVVCSFAMHLVAASWLPMLCMQLKQISPALLILTPHKRPDIKSAWGWTLREEVMQDRVRARLYD